MSNVIQAKKGFSLIEVLIVVFIMMIAFISFYSVSTLGTRYIIEAKNKLAATALVNEKMEIIRNLEYDNVGTQGSIDIPGNIPQEVDVTANGRTYHVSTSVRYFDDPMDGTATSMPADTIPNDYKIIRVIVSWIDSNGQTQSVSSASRFVPPGLETSVGGSPLSINVIDEGTLLPIYQASVHITNSTTVPVINDTIQTSADGNIMLPAAKVSTANHLTISKSGYETIQTMDSSPTFIPLYGHVSVVTGFLNTYNYYINKLSNLKVVSTDYQNAPIGNIGFSIAGGKIIGHDNLNNNVLSMPLANETTGAVNGEKNHTDISPGSYDISMLANAQYEFIDYDPSVTPAVVVPGTDATYTIHVADKNVNALFLEIKDADVLHDPIAGAKATLKDGAVDIFTEKLSSTRGVVFYPDSAVPLQNKTYTLEVSADGYDTETQSVTIDKLTHVAVQMTKN